MVDEPGSALRLTLYGQDGREIAVAVSVQRALAIAGELIAAASRRLG